MQPSHMERNRRPRLGVLTVSAVLLVFLGYLFVPVAQISLPPQQQFRGDGDIRAALVNVSEAWGVPEDDLYVFAAHITPYGDKSVAIIDPTTLSSAKVWIASPQPQPGQPTSGLKLVERIHMLTNYTPQSTLERAIAHNFYIRGGWAQSHKTVITHIEADLPWGQIRSSSLDIGLLRTPTLLTYPLFFLSFQVDIF